MPRVPKPPEPQSLWRLWPMGVNLNAMKKFALDTAEHTDFGNILIFYSSIDAD